MNNVFFFQSQQIPDNSSLFDELKEQKIFFSYFQVDQNYYLFVYAQKSIDINFLYQSIDVIHELDSKQRKIRSFRGFFLYALEIIQNGKDYEILATNLQPFFWKKVHNIIRQNKKATLQEFLFGGEVTRMGKGENSKPDNQASNPRIQLLEDQIQNLHNQVHSLAEQVERLQQKIIQLEQNQNIARERNLNVVSEAPKRPKIDSSTLEQSDYTLEGKKGPYLTENDPKRGAVFSEIRNPTYQQEGMQSKSLSDASKIDFKTSDISEQYNITSITSN